MTASEGFADVVLAVGIVPSLYRLDVRFLCIAEARNYTKADVGKSGGSLSAKSAAGGS